MEDDALRRFRTQMRMLGRRLRRELPPVPGVSRSAVQVLRVVARAPEPSPSDVAEKLRMTSSNVAAALRELECAELVRRVRDPEDGRRVRLSMTDAGAEAISCLHAERDTWLGRAIAALLSDDEQITLLRAGELMQRLAEYEPVDPVDPADPPDPVDPADPVDPSDAADPVDAAVAAAAADAVAAAVANQERRR
jgi:DNA-binding MarR family transcriptional regulator